MKTNKVAPWEGRLKWVGTPRTGKGRNGDPWSSVDFVLEYTDEGTGKERNIMFNLFGNEKVNELFTRPIGTKLRVKWKPEAREFNGKWWSQLSAYEVEALEGGNTASARPSEPVDSEGEDDDFPL